MDPPEYSTFAAYYGQHGKIIFGLTTKDFGEGWYNPSSLGIRSLDYAFQVDERELRVSLARVLMDRVIDSKHDLRLDLDQSNTQMTSLDVALSDFFRNPHYRRAILFLEPRTIELPNEWSGTIENLTGRLEGDLRRAYIRVVESSMHKPPITA